MNTVITMNPRGTLTLPRQVRRRFGLERGGTLIAEETEGGILLRPGQVLPVEIYSDERVAEFDAEERRLAAALRRRKARTP
jgi:bifunctional DNA-binding transcriptional regulator/antitoxin component of YhaV-PrlF toxin-antitoxin module